MTKRKLKKKVKRLERSIFTAKSWAREQLEHAINHDRNEEYAMKCKVTANEHRKNALNVYDILNIKPDNEAIILQEILEREKV